MSFELFLTYQKMVTFWTYAGESSTNLINTVCIKFTRFIDISMFNAILAAHKKLKHRQMKKFLALGLSDVVFIILTDVKMPIIVDILTNMSRINFVLSFVEHGKSFITSRPGKQCVA